MRDFREASPIAVKADLSGPLPLLGQFQSYVDFEVLANPPKQWKYQKPAPSDAKISLRIGLKLQNVVKFQQMVIDLSTPGHPTFGQHMTQGEINAIIGPSQECAQLVLEWLKASGIHAVHDGQWVKADVTVAQAQVLLQTQFGVYLNTLSGKTAIRTLSYRVPEVLKDHVDLVQPTNMFGLEPLIPRPSKATLRRRDAPEVNENESSNTDCNHRVTPQCLMKLYNMETLRPRRKSISTVGVAGFLGEYANRADLQTFLKLYQPGYLGREYNTTLVEGGLDDQTKPGHEANLDIQYTAGLMPPEAVTYYSVGLVEPPFIPDKNTPTNTNEPYMEFLDFLIAQDKKFTEAPEGKKDEKDRLPDTISISYADYEQTVPLSYAKRVCDLFMQLGARGTTVLVASGDYGVGGNATHPSEAICLKNDGSGDNRPVFQPLFPASCPFVTTVGGTVGMSPESAVKFSGGGFSNYFEQQPYQKDVVTKYLGNLGPKHSGLFKPTGRAYPDVAAQGDNFQIVANGKVLSIGGTSASTPVFATIVWYINDELRSQGKPPLGFLNPKLYDPKISNALNDIVLGNNPGCGTTGFNAASGWDPVTGLGTPNLGRLMNALAPKTSA
ncbi:hypothetical protein BGZ68_002442 [Mortierella alpina]|nr:hypothetical protein BGZ68_002442 [Mortierella alpina]